MTLFLRLLFNALGLMVIAYVVTGIEVTSFFYACIAALVLGLLNLVVRPILILLTFPITFITLGLFALVINAGLFWLAATALEGFEVAGFVPAFIGALAMSLVSTLANWWITDN